MRSKKLILFEVIQKAVAGEPESADTVGGIFFLICAALRVLK